MRILMTAILLAIMSLMATLAFGDADTEYGAYYSTQQVLNKVHRRTPDILDIYSNQGGELCTDVKTTTKASGGPYVRYALSADTAIISVWIKPLKENKGLVYIGGSSVSTDTGYILSGDQAGDSWISLNIDNLADVYMITELSNDGVSFIATKE